MYKGKIGQTRYYALKVNLLTFTIDQHEVKMLGFHIPIFVIHRHHYTVLGEHAFFLDKEPNAPLIRE